jgi:hypothetical protein
VLAGRTQAAVDHRAEQPFSSELEPFYNAPLLYDQPRTELRFETDILDLPIMPDEDRLGRYLASIPSLLLVRYRDETSVSERVRAILRHNLRKHLSLEEVAAMLAVSPQTLRRRLQHDDNCGFQDLKRPGAARSRNPPAAKIAPVTRGNRIFIWFLGAEHVSPRLPALDRYRSRRIPADSKTIGRLNRSNPGRHKRQ